MNHSIRTLTIQIITTFLFFTLSLPIQAETNPSQDDAQISSQRSGGIYVGSYTDIDVKSYTFPIISYYDATNGDLKLAVCVVSTCTKYTTHTIDSVGNVGAYTSIKLNSSGSPVISYYDITNQNLKLAICNNTQCTNPIIRTIDEEGNTGTWTSLVLTSSNIPIISYYDDTDSDLKLATCNTVDCATHTLSTVDGGPTVDKGSHSAIAITPAHKLVISHYNGSTRDLELVVCADITCSSKITRIIDSTGDTGLFSSVATTSSGIPIISYYDATYLDLNVAVCNDYACSTYDTFSPDHLGWVGEYTSIALTSTNAPVISYYDYTNESLKLIVCANTRCSTWTTYSLDDQAGAEVGWHSAIALNQYNQPFISYADITNGMLKLARCEYSSLSNAVCNNPTIYTLDQGQPNSFAKTAPANRSIVKNTTSVTLSWESVPNATSYEYCFVTVAQQFNCTNWTNTGTSTSVIKSGLTPTQTYVWQVRAKNTAGYTMADATSATTPQWSFTVMLQPSAFVKSTPSQNATVTTDNVKLSWGTSTGATQYEYCISLITSPCLLWQNAGTATNVTVSGLINTKTYQWQIRAKNVAGVVQANNNTFWRFTVSIPPGSFSKSSPNNAAVNQPSTLTLSWNPSAFATSYEYCLAPLPTPCTNWVNTTSRTVTVKGLTKNKTYQWQVRAKNAVSTTVALNPTWQFTTAR